MNYWFKKSLRRNLIDMHINDIDPLFLSEFSADKYAEALSLSGVDTAVIYGGSCLGINYFSTSNGHRHNSIGTRDLIAETVSTCRAKGLNIVLYFNIWSRWAYDNHPEWRMIDIDGRGYSVEMGERFGQCCPNTGYSEYVKRLFGDLVGGYDCQGYWIDMIGWFTNICYCDSCKKRFKDETGFDIPSVIDWENEVFQLFVRKREEWFAETARGLTQIVKRKDPALTIAHQCSSWTLGWIGGCTKEFFACSDYLAGDFYVYGAVQSVTLKYLANMTSARPVEYMVSRCPDLSDHTLVKPDYELTAQRYAAIAGNASFVFIDAIDPVGTIDERIYRKMGEIFAESEKFEKFIDTEAELLSDAGLIVSQYALINLKDNGKDIRQRSFPFETLENVYNAAEALIHANITFDVLDLSSPEKLRGKKVLILCDIPRMTEKDAQTLREYVQNGGRIYASCRTSLSGGEFMLADVFGVNYAGAEEHTYNYFAPLPEYEDMLGGFNGKYPMSVKGTFVKVSTGADKNQTETLAVTSHCRYKPGDIYMFASAISNPPAEKPTDKPCLVRNRYGKGMSMYSCGVIEAGKSPNLQNVFASLIKSMIDKPLIVSNAPRQIEVQVFRNGRKTTVNLNSCITPFPPSIIYDTDVSLYIGNAEIESVTDIGAEKNIKYDIIDGYLNMRVSEILYFNSLQILFKQPQNTAL
jgi:hypothetical protein